MITPRHAVVANHWTPADGSLIRFVGISNTAYTRTVVGHKLLDATVDYAIIVLDTDLPADVERVRLLPYEALHKLTASQQASWGASCLSSRLPAVGFNLRKDAFIFDVTVFWNSWMDGAASLWFPSWGSSFRRTSTSTCGFDDVTAGDSGCPTFLLPNNELVLIGPWWQCGNVASWQGNFLSYLNQTIVDVDIAAFGQWTGYSATTYPVSSFPSLW